MNSSSTEEFDLVVLGSGEGSKFLAWTSARQGKKVAVIEHRWIGGSCPNVACLPSKNIIHSAKVASYVARAEEFGICVPEYSIDMAKVTERKRSMVQSLIDIHVRNFETSGAELILGHGTFVAPRTIQVDLQHGGQRHLRGANVVIGTGTRASLDDVPGLEAARPMTHIEVMELNELPRHLLVFGGGYVGLEFAQAFRRLGSQVTIVDHNASLLHREDPDAGAAMEALFQEESIHLILNAKVRNVSGRSGQSITLTYVAEGSEQTLEASHLLVALGRTPNTQNIGLDLAGVELTSGGYVKVDRHLRTSADGVWACGDVTGGPQFTHVAFDDFRILRDNLAGGDRATTGRRVPYSLFTDPELAHIGLNETEANALRIPYRIFKIAMAADLRTRTLSETRGFMKALVGANDQILGFSVFGVDGGELMSAVQIAMIGNLPYTAIRDAMLAHPTLIEGLIVLFSSVPSVVDPATCGKA
ncbi:MAG TPA: FAD-dependent oxidoreductase [Acidobacteriaceae bacterium]|nr:FAD-dependent oxidoreductase [Acidobacteriaceae bacterium]